MRRRAILPIALALLAAGCGQDSSRNLIPPADAETLLAAVERIDTACADNDVSGARAAVAEAKAQIAGLPPRVDDALEQNLNAWVGRIDRRLERDCEEPEATATPAPEETEEPVPTETATPVPTETAEPTVTPEPTVIPPEDVPGDEGDGGGVQAPGSEEGR